MSGPEADFQGAGGFKTARATVAWGEPGALFSHVRLEKEDKH
jgi:hypothetical protein